MADIDVHRKIETEASPAADYTVLHVILWVIGILMIPLVPILMIALLTPRSGM